MTSMLSNHQVSAPYKRMGATHESNSFNNMPTGRLSLRPFCITEYMALVALTANFVFALVNFPFQVNNIPRYLYSSTLSRVVSPNDGLNR